MHESFPGLCLSTLLQARAEQTPDAPAILAPGRAPLSYRRFYEQMAAVVLHLQAMGLGRQDRIALVLPNGPQMAVAALSVTAGAICAPLNPAYRAREFDFYFEALHPRALIVQQGVASSVRAVAQARGLRLIELVETDDGVAGCFALSGAASPHAAAPTFTEPDDVALVLHTSGTTSRAKVVPLTQANICTAASHLCAALTLTANDRCLNMLPLFHTYGLVAATLTSLMAGASTVCLAGFEAAQFFASLADDQPTWYQAVPAMHQAILAQAAAYRDHVAQCRLRFIRSGSTPLPPAVRVELERTFNATVIEGYGMVEASGPVTCNPPPLGPYKQGSIGASIGPEVAIVDAHGAPLGAGTIGEIVVRGTTVMQGYENDALANDQAFLQGWFRSGDAGYMDAEGYVFLTGRLKEMINRGGEKIAPQEVDEILLDHPAVAQAVTFALPHTQLGEAIAAAVVLHPHATATARDIRRFTAARLAAYKVPQQVFIVPELPKDPTGLKPQRHAVAASLGLTLGQPAPASSMGADVALPHASLATVVARIWADVLQVEHVGWHDNFFALGGHSLLAMQALSRLQQALQTHLSPRILFDGPTVAEVVQHIETADQIERDISFALPEQTSRPEALPATAAQEQMWLFDQIFLGTSCFTIPYLLRLTGALQVTVLERSLNEIIRRHEALRTTFRLVEGQLVQTVVPGSEAGLPQARFDLKIEDLSSILPREREALAQQRIQDEIKRPFDLDQGPLVRGYLIRFGPQAHGLLITMHHIMSDGWSLGVFARELAVLYDAFVAGEPSPLTALPMQYADYALWQQQWRRSRARDIQVDYWKGQLRGPLKTLPLPIDRPREHRLSFSTARQAFALSSVLSEALARLSQEAGSTLFMALLAACNILLCRYTNQTDIHVGTLVANRHAKETEALIGLLTNTVILRTQLHGDPTYREVLRRVRETTLAAYAHQQLPFEELAPMLQGEMAQQPTDLCQVMLILQHAMLRPAELPSRLLHMAEMDENVMVSHFPPMTSDLVLMLRETSHGLVGSCIYKTSLFNRSTIQRFLKGFQNTLDVIVIGPDTPMSALEI